MPGCTGRARLVSGGMGARPSSDTANNTVDAVLSDAGVPQCTEKTRIYYADTADQEQEHGADPLQCQTTLGNMPLAQNYSMNPGNSPRLLLGIKHSGRPMRSTPTPLQSTVVLHDRTPERRGGGRTPL